MKHWSESLTGHDILARRRFGEEAPLTSAVFMAMNTCCKSAILLDVEVEHVSRAVFIYCTKFVMTFRQRDQDLKQA